MYQNDYRIGIEKEQVNNYHQIRTLRSQVDMIKMIDTLQKLFSKRLIKMWNNFIDGFLVSIGLKSPLLTGALVLTFKHSSQELT